MPVYIIRAGETPYVKIGWAADVADRIKQHQCGNHETLHLLRTAEGDRSTEAWFHRRFCQRQHRAEWFVFHPAMLTVEAPAVAPPRADTLPFKSKGIVIGNLARSLQISPEAVRLWSKGDRCISPRYLADVERITGIPRHELRPDLYSPPTQPAQAAEMVRA